jgi:hypothetical protein
MARWNSRVGLPRRSAHLALAVSAPGPAAAVTCDEQTKRPPTEAAFLETRPGMPRRPGASPTETASQQRRPN